ncbi:MAG: hypothetical protein IPG50_03615 [Myxococcales bacterium]|nr:hypothetical protein [Myxococcales bacterium]
MLIRTTKFTAALTLLTACSGSGPLDVDGASGPQTAGPTFLRAPEEVPSTKLVSGTCPYAPANAVFQRAICVCNDLSLSGSLETKATLGGAADVGVNGAFSASSTARIGGALIAHDGVQISGDVEVKTDLATAKNVVDSGSLRVTRDLVGGGNVWSSGDLHVGGALKLGGELVTSGASSVGARAAYPAPVMEPCGCEGKTLFDVKARVAAAKAQNDNGKVTGVGDDVVTSGQGQLTLPTGNYYVKSLSTSGSHKLKIDGAVALHVDGDFVVSGAEAIEIAKGASLDLFVAGNLASSGDLALGEGAEAGAFRVYVGGTEVAHSGSQRLHGLLYAPHARVGFSGGVDVVGAVFAKELAVSGSLVVDYRGATPPAANVCTPEPTPAGASGSPALK